MKRPDLLGFPFGRVLGEDPQDALTPPYTNRRLSVLKNVMHVPFNAMYSVFGVDRPAGDCSPAANRDAHPLRG